MIRGRHQRLCCEVKDAVNLVLRQGASHQPFRADVTVHNVDLPLEIHSAQRRARGLIALDHRHVCASFEQGLDEP